jgi:hypothetical protein
VNSIGQHTPGDCRIWWDSVVQPCFFSDQLVSEGAMRSFAVCFHRGTCLRPMMKSVVENGMEAEIRGLMIVVRVTVICDLEQRHRLVGATAHEKFIV